MARAGGCILMKMFIASMIVVFSFLAIGISVTSPVMAQSFGAATGTACKHSFFGIPAWYEYLPLNGDCTINTDATGGNTIVLVVMAVTDILLFVAGFVAGFYVIYGGFKYITSTAEPTKISAAKTTILNAIIGLAIAIIASAVVSFIAGRLT